MCPGCKKLRLLESFKSSKLRSGFGIKCRFCVPYRNKKNSLNTINSLSDDKKRCPDCNHLRPLSYFKSNQLKSGYGTKCKLCVPNRNSKKKYSSIPTKKTLPGNKFCPKCDSVMFLRSGNWGKFYGCRRWPACNGTRKK